VRTAESSTARESRRFSKAPINLLNGTFACDDVSQEDGLRLRANILTSLPYLRSLYPSIATSLLAKVSHMSFYTKLITEQQKTMREIGSIHEDYNRVAATVTAVSRSTETRRTRSFRQSGTHMIARLPYLRLRVPVGIRSCTLISRCSDQSVPPANATRRSLAN
jgi:hypothetical protein